MASGCPNALASAKQLTNALMQPLFRRTFVNTGKFCPSQGEGWPFEPALTPYIPCLVAFF